LIGAAISAAGLVLLGAYKLAAGDAGTLAGFLLVIVAALGWAAGNVIAKRAAGEHDENMFALVVSSSIVLPLAALSYAFEGGLQRGRR
jgi:O-acetylserine/cysteine efflux transporter